MTSDAIVKTIIDALTAIAAPHMLTGSLAGNYYSVPRVTQDADSVADMPGDELTGMAGKLGPPFR